MKITKRKAIIDDGMNPELVVGAEFDGYSGIPVIKKPKDIIIPTSIIPFTKRTKAALKTDAICFNEMDKEFADILISPSKYVNEFRGKIIISPDCSLYRDAPYSVQVTNIYRSRAIGYYCQKNGAYVIPLVRWGNELTYTTKVFPEKIAFLGVEKHSIVAIGTYGCIKSREDKYYFKAGLEEMLIELEPVVILVYGAMPKSVFSDYLTAAKFIPYPDWITKVHGGDR